MTICLVQVSKYNKQIAKLKGKKIPPLRGKERSKTERKNAEPMTCRKLKI